ncbi:UNVERIFIED_CONTAM: hypothetical protein NCL1_12434 [Trichonephila clavipes]
MFENTKDRLRDRAFKKGICMTPHIDTVFPNRKYNTKFNTKNKIQIFVSIQLSLKGYKRLCILCKVTFSISCDESVRHFTTNTLGRLC